jgi:hypothetical protein
MRFSKPLLGISIWRLTVDTALSTNASIALIATRACSITRVLLSISTSFIVGTDYASSVTPVSPQ